MADNLKKENWTSIGGSETSPIDNKARKEVKTKLPVCWIEDHEKEISVNPTGRYSESYNIRGVSNSLNVGQRKFKIYVPLKTKTEITVEVSFKVTSKLTPTGTESEKAAAITTAIASAKTAFEKGVKANWNKKFKLEVSDPVCGKKIFDIVYKVVWVTSGENFTINVHKAYPREGVTGLVMDVSDTTTEWVYAHEFGHCIGLPDEYSYTTDIETVKYYKPNGILDVAISAPPDGKDATDADATIMAAYDSLKTVPRHAWNIAIEVQDLLTSKIGRKITCNIL
jgi:type VI secretion system secreted protein VgrG